MKEKTVAHVQVTEGDSETQSIVESQTMSAEEADARIAREFSQRPIDKRPAKEE